MPALIKRVTHDPEPLIRSHALRAIAHLDPEKAATFIEKLIDDSDPQVREEARMLEAV